MPKVLVTGMSGTGKSAALQALGERGHRVVDTDTGQWSCWVTLPDGSPDWIWREDAIKTLLASHRHGYLFYPQFDHIALLSAPAEVEPLLRATATVEVDASAPLSVVVRQLENLT